MPCRTRLVSGRIFKLSEDTAASHLERPAPTEFEIGQEMMGRSGCLLTFAKWLRDSDSMVFSAGHVPTIFFSSVVASDLPLLKRHNSRPQKARHPARRHRARHRAIILRRFQPTKRPLIQEATAIMATILMVLSSQWRGHNL